jgi:hypothetical protein
MIGFARVLYAPHISNICFTVERAANLQMHTSHG